MDNIFKDFKIKTMDKIEWVRKHANHNLKEFYPADDNIIVAKIQCMDCGEAYVFDMLDLTKEVSNEQTCRRGH